MQESKRSTRKFLIDTNLFVAAVFKIPKVTKSLELLLRILKDESIELVGNEFLFYEFMRYAERFRSVTALLLLKGLVDKMEIVEVRGENVSKCKPHFPRTEVKDIMHAATCLQTDAVLITNNYRHFKKIADSGIIEVWSIHAAMRHFIKS